MKRILSFISLLLLSSFCFAQYVGVGVPNPQEKLDVAGGVKLDILPAPIARAL
ncbi:hypothetical protein BH09BAC2_BH09BAC2_04840 [soil metagenome]